MNRSVILRSWLLSDCLDRCGAQSSHTRVELIEPVTGGTLEAIEHGSAAPACQAYGMRAGEASQHGAKRKPRSRPRA